MQRKLTICPPQLGGWVILRQSFKLRCLG